MTGNLRVLVSGMVAGVVGQGGATWAVLQWVLGLRRLGHRVVLVEPVDAAALGAAHADQFASLQRDFDVEGALVGDRHRTVGMPFGDVAAAAADSDLLINIAGMLTEPELFEPPHRRVYLDLDPAFTQLWHAVEGIDMRFEGHDRFVTVGTRVGSPTCAVPTCGLTWRTTLPVVSLPDWPVAEEIVHDAFTTVGNWRGYGSIIHDGVQHGQRAHSMRGLATLPRLVDERLAVALSIHPEEVDDLDVLRRNGWELVDPAVVAATPSAYQRFVQGSRAELGIAKSGYVVSACGWFSDRTACYLASGRPAVVQDTGFGHALPVGTGVLTYSSVDEAAEAVRAVASDYERHASGARALAEEHLAAARVLPPLLDELLR